MCKYTYVVVSRRTSVIFCCKRNGEIYNIIILCITYIYLHHASVRFHGNYTVKPPQQSVGRNCTRVQDVVGVNSRADIAIIKRFLL